MPAIDFGLHRAIVVDAVDPDGRRRVRISAPALLGPGDRWAAACSSPGSTAVPAVGTTVWIMFEDGDVMRPVWVGVAA